MTATASKPLLQSLTEAEAAELARYWWRKDGRRLSIAEYLATDPDGDYLRAALVRTLDRPRRGGILARVLADHLGLDPDAVYAEHYPRKAARLAAECRARGDHPHADKLQTALIALMQCANCGRPLADPLSIVRGIGPDCWPRIDPAWRQSIEARLTAPGNGTEPAAGGTLW